MNRSQLWNAGSPLVLFCGLLLLSPASAVAANLVPFDAPGAETGANEGTFGLAINDAGQITGYYVDPNGLAHAFVRDHNGTISGVEAPGAVGGTFAFAINQEGDITGTLTTSTSWRMVLFATITAYSPLSMPRALWRAGLEPMLRASPTMALSSDISMT